MGRKLTFAPSQDIAGEQKRSDNHDCDMVLYQCRKYQHSEQFQLINVCIPSCVLKLIRHFKWVHAISGQYTLPFQTVCEPKNLLVVTLLLLKNKVIIYDQLPKQLFNLQTMKGR